MHEHQVRAGDIWQGKGGRGGGGKGKGKGKEEGQSSMATRLWVNKHG